MVETKTKGTKQEGNSQPDPETSEANPQVQEGSDNTPESPSTPEAPKVRSRDEILAAARDGIEGIVGRIRDTIMAALGLADDDTSAEATSYVEGSFDAVEAFAEGLEKLVKAPVEGRLPIHEANEKALRESPEYGEAVELVLSVDGVITEAEGYPHGRLPEKAEAALRKRFQFPFKETPENRDQLTPLKPLKLHVAMSTGSSPRSTTATGSGEGRGSRGPRGESLPKGIHIRDRVHNKSGISWDILWAAWAEDEKDAVNQVVLSEKHKASFGSKVPNKFYNATNSGTEVIRLMREEGVDPVASWATNNAKGELEQWGKAQRMAGGVPRFCIWDQDAKAEGEDLT